MNEPIQENTLRHLKLLMNVLATLALAASFAPGAEPRKRALAFDGSSAHLKATQVVPTLDTPIPAGKNAIWCASFLCAWRTLAENVAGEPLSMPGAKDLLASLNAAHDPRPDIPPAALCVAAGWKRNGIEEQIRKELALKFPAKQPPYLANLASNAIVAWSYLEAQLKFSIAYRQNPGPLAFADGSGRKTSVGSFGLTPGADPFSPVRRQPGLLFQKGKPESGDFEFAIDLCLDSGPNQLIVGRISRPSTLAAALARIEQQAKVPGSGVPAVPKRLTSTDYLLVPDMGWQIAHRFTELEGRPFTNSKLKGQRLDLAEQDILFRLDRTGVELKSEANLAVNALPTNYSLDRPFLICMKQRGAPAPYFAMWVDNAELLSRWQNKPNRR
jgi:hypothetical protein